MALRIRACQFGMALVTILSRRPWKPHPFLIGYSFSAEVIAVGYTLTSDVREDRLFILEGKGSNGKTVFLNILLLGVDKVGANKYTEGKVMEVDLHEYRQESAEEQIQRLREVKRERDNRKVSQLLKDLERAVRTEKNVMPYLLECCKNYATVGEMTKVFKGFYREFKEPSIF